MFLLDQSPDEGGTNKSGAPCQDNFHLNENLGCSCALDSFPGFCDGFRLGLFPRRRGHANDCCSRIDVIDDADVLVAQPMRGYPDLPLSNRLGPCLISFRFHLHSSLSFPLLPYARLDLSHMLRLFTLDDRGVHKVSPLRP